MDGFTKVISEVRNLVEVSVKSLLLKNMEAVMLLVITNFLFPVSWAKEVMINGNSVNILVVEDSCYVHNSVCGRCKLCRSCGGESLVKSDIRSDSASLVVSKWTTGFTWEECCVQVDRDGSELSRHKKAFRSSSAGPNQEEGYIYVAMDRSVMSGHNEVVGTSNANPSIRCNVETWPMEDAARCISRLCDYSRGMDGILHRLHLQDL
ncbi:hypothetical protein VNO78_08647 [Psophocarpus tetragonolobus]|uniref:Uncharacterized protein n=1 Tax=Psophocarpus tetragonolobus TaxID=3891 RepID=A0AAN9SVC2_PSOTE